MKKELKETYSLRKSFSNPQLKVVRLAGADVISTSDPRNTEGYEDGDTSNWYPTNP